MLWELKLPRKSPTSLPTKSPMLYISNMMMLVHTGPRLVFLASVKLGNSMKVTTKSKQMNRGYGFVILNASHINRAYDFSSLAVASVLLYFASLLLIIDYCSPSSVAVLFALSILVLYSSVLNRRRFKIKSKKLKAMERQK